METKLPHNVRIVSYNGYYHLYKEIDGQHWVGMIDNRIGNLTNQVSAETAETFKDANTNCYDQKNIDSFSMATIEQLKQFENT